MWVRFRRWKHAVAPLVIVVAYMLLQLAPEQSASWFVGLSIAALVGLAYVIEEVVWNIEGAGRPCAACGHQVRMRSFRVRNTCPACGQQL
jgi:hypothetical protein